MRAAAVMLASVVAVTRGPIANTQQIEPTSADLAPILNAVGVTTQPRGLTTLRYRDGGGGGQIMLPPEATASGLCAVEFRSFTGDGSVGYFADGNPGRTYWLPVGAGDCSIETPEELPAERTGTDDTVTLDQLAALIARTDEFIQLARRTEKCEIERGAAQRAFGFLEDESLHLSSVTSADVQGDFTASLSVPGMSSAAYMYVTVIDNEFTSDCVRTEFWSPFAYQDELWEFFLP